MQTCFIIQPFDKGKFDKRFEDTFRPAIEEAGLEAYRVDQDPNVEIPIEAIEEGIRDASWRKRYIGGELSGPSVPRPGPEPATPLWSVD